MAHGEPCGRAGARADLLILAPGLIQLSSRSVQFAFIYSEFPTIQFFFFSAYPSFFFHSDPDCVRLMDVLAWFYFSAYPHLDPVLNIHPDV